MSTTTSIRSIRCKWIGRWRHAFKRTKTRSSFRELLARLSILLVRKRASPQAWASAAPIHLARALLGLEPEVHRGVVRARPRVPERLSTLSVTGLPLAGGRLHLRARGDRIEAAALPEGLQWVVEGVVGQQVAP